MSNQQNEAIAIVEDILNGPAMLFHDQYNHAFIAPVGNGSQVMKINSSEFKSWLTGKLWGDYSNVISSGTISNVLQTLTGVANFESREIDLSVRTSYIDGHLWYDCGKSAIEISTKGWYMKEKPPVLFRRFAHQKKQTIPEYGGNIKDLLPFVNLQNESDKLLFLVFTISAFIPGFPHPILILHGPQGAGKSTPMRLIKELVDPSTIQGVAAPKDPGQFGQFAHHHSVLMFDNLSGMPVWLSDALARASTGDGFSKRTLFTDDDDFVFKIQKVIMLNGINQVVTKADLLDRSILLSVKRIDAAQRIPEDQFWKNFNDKRASLLGAIFDSIAKAMSIYPTVTLTELPRMADFAKWGYAIAEAIGYKGNVFIDAYTENIGRQNEEAIEASPVAQAIIEFMSDKTEWSDTAATLLQSLNRIAKFNDLKSSVLWPKDPQWLSKRLNEIEPNLQTRGIFFTRYVHESQRVIHFTRTSDSTDDINP
jgi:hypothetical protein